MNIIVTASYESNGNDIDTLIFDNSGAKGLVGSDFGDLETGKESSIIWYYFRHDGENPIYDTSFYIRALGLEWGGYVPDADDSRLPYNPNFFRNGGLDEDGNITTSTADYDLMRTLAYNNPEMGVRLHMDRNDETVKTNGLGYENKGLSFSSLPLASTSLDYSKSSNEELDGYIYATPADQSKVGQDGDEAKVGVSIKLPDDLEDSGHIQFSLVMKYRYTI